MRTNALCCERSDDGREGDGASRFGGAPGDRPVAPAGRPGGGLVAPSVMDPQLLWLESELVSL